MPNVHRNTHRLMALSATVILLAACSGSPQTPEESSAPAAASDGGTSSTPAAAEDPATTSAPATSTADAPSQSQSQSPSASEDEGTGKVRDLEDFAVEGGYAFTALDGDMYCVLNPSSDKPRNIVGERLELSTDAGVHCLMAEYPEPDVDDPKDQGIAPCLKQQDEEGVGEPSGGEPSLTGEVASYAGCRSDVNALRGSSTDIRAEMGEVTALEPGQSVGTESVLCTAIDDSVQCTRADGGGWKVSTTAYSMLP